jgi:hypothetical protein
MSSSIARFVLLRIEIRKRHGYASCPCRLPAYMYVSELALEMPEMDRNRRVEQCRRASSRGGVLAFPGGASDRLVKHLNFRSFCCHLRRKDWPGPAAAMEFPITLAIAVIISHAAMHRSRTISAESARREPRAHGD